MVADDLSLGGDNDAFRIDSYADWTIGEGRGHAVAIAIQMDQARRRHALGVFDEAGERARRLHQMPDLFGPGVGNRARMRGVRRLSPQLPAARLQPVVQRRQRGKGGRRLPEPMAGVLDVLLDLPLLPAGSWIAELRLEQEVADHGCEPCVDLAVLAAPDLVDRGAHVMGWTSPAILPALPGTKEGNMSLKLLAIDLGKRSFHCHGIDSDGVIF